jgi:hypothetical protein
LEAIVSETTIGGNGSSGYKKKELKTLSGQFVVPANVYRIRLAAQGAGASGWSNKGTTLQAGGGGGAGGYIAADFNVMPGDVLTYVIGAGGVGSTPNSGNSGGNTTVLLNKIPLLIALGGVAGPDGGGGAVLSFCSNTDHLHVLGGNGGDGADGGLPGTSGGMTVVRAFNSSGTTTAAALGAEVASGGNAGPGGGGGGSSVYGKGGNGGNPATAGQAAPAMNYGAGGGGGGGNSSGSFIGGNGANGCVEIWY